MIKDEKIIWSSTADFEKAYHGGIEILDAIIGSPDPYNLNQNPYKNSINCEAGLYYNDNLVYSIILPTQCHMNPHLLKMYRLLCMSSKNAPKI